MSLWEWLLFLLFVLVSVTPAKEREQSWHYIRAEKHTAEWNKRKGMLWLRIKRLARLYSFICYKIKHDVFNRTNRKGRTSDTL